MNWGRSIVVAFVLFASYIGYLVYVCISQPDIFLVEKEYYSSELKFGAKLESLQRGKQKAQLSYISGEEKLVLAFNKNPQAKTWKWLFTGRVTQHWIVRYPLKPMLKNLPFLLKIFRKDLGKSPPLGLKMGLLIYWKKSL